MAVVPAAFSGFAGLADGVGPKGWRGFAEVFGWFEACLLTAALLTFLLARGGRVGIATYSLALAAVAGIGALAYKLMDWLGLEAPTSAKAVFTFSLQVLGGLGVAICVILIASTFWKRVVSCSRSRRA